MKAAYLQYGESLMRRSEQSAGSGASEQLGLYARPSSNTQKLLITS